MMTATPNIQFYIQNKKILIVDDNEVLRDILGDHYAEMGADVSKASTGREALEKSLSQEYAIILTDIRMPEMSGIDFLRELPGSNKKAIKVMMSGEASMEEVVQGYKEEIDEFILKPFQSLKAIDDLLCRLFMKHEFEQELDYKNSVMHHYYEILQYLVSSTDPKKLFLYTFESMKRFIPLNRMELLLFDSERKLLTLKYLFSDEATEMNAMESVETEESGLSGMLSGSTPFLSVKDLASYCTTCQSPIFERSVEEGMKSGLFFPLTVDSSVFGFIGFYSKTIGAYLPAHGDILKGIVPKISVAFERAIYQGRLHEENTFLRHSVVRLSDQLVFQQEALIYSLAELAEKRDKDTGKHLQRIQTFSHMLAEAYFQGKDKVDIGCGMMDVHTVINLIWKTSPLHDIGKVAIPDVILLKPGKLTPPEFEIIKTHARIGSECLNSAAERVKHSEFLHVARDIALYHHERWDGSGYPEGLKGENIPLAARIVAIADNYDALRSQRPYKPPWDRTMVCSYFIDQKGRQFDPELVDLFLRMEAEMDRVYERAGI